MSRDASADLDSVLSNDEFLTTEVDLLRTPHVLCTPVIWPDLKYKDVRYSLLDRRTEYLRSTYSGSLFNALVRTGTSKVYVYILSE